MQQIPPRTAMQQWTLMAVRKLGGSGHNREIEEQVRSILNLPEEISEELRPNGRETVLDHRIAWARTHLKAQGLLENPQRAIWALTEAGTQQANSIASQVIDITESIDTDSVSVVEVVDDEAPVSGEEWQDDLLTRILRLSPGAFERLCQRLLRESGFVQVQVTGRAGDHGIDGHGLLQMARLVSFPVFFQCKRWQNPVGPSVVRDFRGAMQGRADRGLIITTSTFTAEARKEAARDGAPPVDLVAGYELAANLRELKLGVQEIVIVDNEWFDQLESWASDGQPAAGEVFDVS